MDHCFALSYITTLREDGPAAPSMLAGAVLWIFFASETALSRACLSGVERIEFLLEALVGRFAGVDRAADGESGSRGINPGHGPLSRLS
jgi:hypothetical protein